MTGKIVVLCTCATLPEAERIARALVEERLAACVNVVAGLKSVYRWKGAIEEAAEHLLLVKTSRDLFDRVRGRISSLHSYDTPEVIALDIADGSPRYLEWLTAEIHGLR